MNVKFSKRKYQNVQLQFYDENNQLVDRYTGEIFRPPIIHLQTRFIRILFRGNGGNGVGYRAEIRYLSQHFTDNMTSTHCGGLVESFGGAITMMNMTNSSAKSFDCIWLIKPPNSYLHLKTHLLVRIDTFENMGKSTKNEKCSTKESNNIICSMIEFCCVCQQINSD